MQKGSCSEPRSRSISSSLPRKRFSIAKLSSTVRDEELLITNLALITE